MRVDDDLVEAFPDEATVKETLRLALKMKAILAKPAQVTTRARSKKSA